MRMWPVWRIPSSNSESLTLSPGNLEITTSIRIEYWCLDIRHMRLLYYLMFYLNRVFRPPVVGETFFSCVFLHRSLYTFHHWTMVSSPRNTRPRNCRSHFKIWTENHRISGRCEELYWAVSNGKTQGNVMPKCVFRRSCWLSATDAMHKDRRSIGRTTGCLLDNLRTHTLNENFVSESRPIIDVKL